MGTYVEEVFVKVTPKGIRCSFDTASTLSGHANAQQTIFGMSAIGLNHKFLLRHRKVEANATHPMSPTYKELTDSDINHLIDRMWGTPSNDTNFGKQFPTTLWTIRSLPFYAGIYYPYHSAEGNSAFHMDTGHIDLTSHTSVFNILDHKDVPCLNYSYKPTFCPLKVKSNISSTDSFMPATHTFHGNINSLQDVNVSLNGGKITAQASTKGISWEEENAYKVPLEQGMYKTKPQRQFHTMSQVHLGILPVQSNAPSDVDADFVNASSIYYVETEIRLNTNINTYYNRADVVSHTDSIYDRDYSLKGLYNYEHVAGLISCNK